MILEVDIGNTRVKWRVLELGLTVASGAKASSLLSDVDGCTEIFGEIEELPIMSVRIASVTPNYDAALSRWCDQVLACPFHFAAVSKELTGVVNGYVDVSQMGVDRWLAILAAWARVKTKNTSCIVVDAGTATTVDVIAGDSVHQGGYIVPGLQMMNDALFRNTGRVKLDSVTFPDSLVLGDGTQAAVLAGLPSMLLGMIEKTYRQLVELGSTPNVIVTGGDGAYIGRLLEQSSGIKAEYIEDLVLDGLSLSVECAGNIDSLDDSTEVSGS